MHPLVVELADAPIAVMETSVEVTPKLYPIGCTIAMAPGTYDRLVEIAAEQHGFVRVADLDVINPVYLLELVGRGRAEHAAYGIYRILAIPPTERDRYHHAALWADRVIAGNAALDPWKLCDVIPGQVDVVLPRGEVPPFGLAVCPS